MLRWVIWSGFVVALLAGTGAATYSGVTQMQAHDHDPVVVDGAPERAEVQGAAKAAVEKILSYDYQTVERRLEAAEASMTDGFAKEFSKEAHENIIPEARRRKATSQANVVGAAVESLALDKASTIVFVNQTFSAEGEQPMYSGSRLRVELMIVNGRWLVDSLDPI